MKKIFTLIVLLTAAVFTVQAWDIIQVVKTDGTVHKYNVDNIERINFVESEDTTDFQTLYITYITETETDTITMTDTLTVTQIDTIYQSVVVTETDTLYITQTDTVTVTQIDTLTITQVDTLTITETDTVYVEVETGDDIRILTFEDEDYVGSDGKGWSSLIDSEQYGGSLLYGSGASTYCFYDEGNTELAWDGFYDSGYGGYYYSFGYAVSCFRLDDFTGASFYEQLSVTTTETPGGSGAAGSANFLVMYCYRDDIETGALYVTRDQVNPLYFADGQAHEPQYVYVTNTSYTLNSLTYGDSFASAATDGTLFTLYAEGTDEDGNIIRTSINLCTDTYAVREWIYFDLTPLGAVTELRFFVMGSDDLCGDWGLNTPGYAALDNLAVKF